jgi:hypothetical protein
MSHYLNPDKLAILELWTDQKTLDAHARLASPPLRPELRAGKPSGKTTRTTGCGIPNSRTLNFKI